MCNFLIIYYIVFCNYIFVPTMIKNTSFKIPFYLHIYMILAHNVDSISPIEPLICSHNLASLLIPRINTPPPPPPPFNHRSDENFKSIFGFLQLHHFESFPPHFQCPLLQPRLKAGTLCAAKSSHRLSFWWSNGGGKLCSARGKQGWTALQHSVSQ